VSGAARGAARSWLPEGRTTGTVWDLPDMRMQLKKCNLDCAKGKVSLIP